MVVPFISGVVFNYMQKNVGFFKKKLLRPFFKNYPSDLESEVALNKASPSIRVTYFRTLAPLVPLADLMTATVYVCEGKRG